MSICTNYFYSLIVIIMRKLIRVILVVFFIPYKGLINGHIDFGGVLSYEHVPIDITRDYSLGIPFLAKENVVVEYFYVVENNYGKTTYFSPMIQFNLPKNVETTIIHQGDKSELSLGLNLLTLVYRFINQTDWFYHYSYFFGFIPGVSLKLNDKNDVRDKLENETVFKYEGYQTNQSHFVTMSIDHTFLNGFIYFEHDLYFDFDTLTIFFNTYTTLAKFDDIVLYFEDKTLFPYFTTVKNEVAIRLKAILNGHVLTFNPFTSLYVEKETHLVSPYWQPNFYKATHLYFPRARIGTMNLEKVRLEIVGFGYCRFNLVYEFMLDVEKPFLGVGGFYEGHIWRY